MLAAGRALRRILDALYLAGGIIAAFFTVAILVLIVLQMLARWTGNVFPGATDYAGYCMAGASFFAFGDMPRLSRSGFSSSGDCPKVAE